MISSWTILKARRNSFELKWPSLESNAAVRLFNQFTASPKTIKSFILPLPSIKSNTSHILNMFYKRILAFLWFTATALSERIAIDATLTNTITRYAWFASAAYSSDCKIPPFNTTVEKTFYDMITDTQATLFRDDLVEEYILAFRGTSSPVDIITDFRRSLVNCTAALPSCVNCTVSRFPTAAFHQLGSKS